MMNYAGGHKVQKGMSSAVALLVGPVIGLVYAVFLPFSGIVMLVYTIAKKMTAGLVQAAVKSSSFGWRPLEAYLDGRQRRITGK